MGPFGPRNAILAVLAAALSACATGEPARLEKTNGVGQAVQQPFRDLNLVRDDVPEVLRLAVQAPYALADPVRCEDLIRDIATLDQVLGPDVDQPRTTVDGSGEALASSLVRGVVGLPFGGVVRNLTGAAARERDFRRAIVAGLARRSYLKGVARTLRCP